MSPFHAYVHLPKSSIGAKESQQQPQIAVPHIIKMDINHSNDILELNVTSVPPSLLVYTTSLTSESDRYHH